MFVDITKEQLMVQKMVKEFSRKVIAPTSKERDEKKEFPFDILNKMGELGLLGMLVPIKYGGAESDLISYLIALYEVAYSCASTAVVMSVHNSIVCETFLAFGNDYQKEKYLTQLAKGNIIGSFALTEPQAGSDPLGQNTIATKIGKHYIINGNKRFITTGKNCGLILLVAKTNIDLKHNGISIFIVESNNPGVTIGHSENKMGLKGSDTVDLIFNDCKVKSSDILGEEGQGFKIAMMALDNGRLGISAQSLGVAQAAFDASVKYINERKQFGKKICSFQGIRWIIAEMATQIEAAKNLLSAAVKTKNAGKNFTLQASMAKLFASEMVNKIVYKAVQLHGGYGYVSDYPVERFYRDARVFTIYEGTSEIQKMVIANNVLGKNY